MKASEMTRKQFDEVPYRENWNVPIECSSIVVLPGRARDMHESGYRLMDFVALTQSDEPICRLSGCSGVIHFDGIGGYGERGVRSTLSTTAPLSAWSIDCLPKSGLLRIFPMNHGMKCGSALSSFEIYSLKR